MKKDKLKKYQDLLIQKVLKEVITKFIWLT